MIRVVLDTNVLVSASFWMGDSFQIVELVKAQQVTAYVSSITLVEYERALRRDLNQPLEGIIERINILSTALIIIETKNRMQVVRNDPDDNHIIEAAVAAEADFLITQELHLLSLETFQEIRIITPRAFLREFHNQ